MRFLRLFGMTLLLLLAVLPAHAQGELETALARAPEELGNNGEQELLESFYKLRHHAPAWQLTHALSQGTLKQFTDYIRTVAREHGLNEARYPLEQFEAKTREGTSYAMAQADILASRIILKLARSLSGEDPIPTSNSQHVWPVRHAAVNLPERLARAVEDKSVPQFLESLAPGTYQYRKLKEALARYRAIEAKGGWIKFVPGERLVLGASSSKVPLLYQRLAQEGYVPFSSVSYTNTIYDHYLANAVKTFQETHGLIPDGNIGPHTLFAMNVGVKERIDSIRVNMARLRTTPPEAWEGVVINIPSFRLFLFRDRTPVYEARVVVGRPDRPTPLVSSKITEIVINPSWYVPVSIAERDILPKLENNPEYLDEMNIESNGGRLRQRPGPGNSLGRIKFNFANRFAVYLHGTPHVKLFDRDDRRQSSGCIRLKKPEELASIVMNDGPEWTPEAIQRRINRMRTQRVRPRTPMPIKLLYWTVMVDAKDRVQFYNDVYQLDDAWLAML